MRFKQLFLAAFFICNTVCAESFNAPKYQGYVTDLGGVLSVSQKQSLEGYSKQLQIKTGIQVATVIIPELKDKWTVDEYANRLFEAWGVGQKGQDNGVLFVVALKEKKMRIEVGYGVEAVIPDGKAGAIMDTYIVPYFKEGHLQKGIVSGHLSLISVIAEASNVQITSSQSRETRVATREFTRGESLLFWLVIMGVVFGMIKSPGLRKFVYYFILMSLLRGGRGSGAGHFGGSGFGGFGGGMSGGGGSSRGW